MSLQGSEVGDYVAYFLVAQQATEGALLSLEVATFTDPGFTNSDAETAETFEAHIDWGDGSPLEAVLVGEDRLLAEVIRVDGEQIVLQVYEDTTGLRPGVEVTGSGAELSVRLGPRLLGHIYDGLLRPLHKQGDYIKPGVRDWQSRRRYAFSPTVRSGDRLEGGAVIGTLRCQGACAQRCLLPPWLDGEVVETRVDARGGTKRE